MAKDVRAAGNAGAGLPVCVHLAGADGTGKTTQSRAIQEWFLRQGIAARRIWLRFPRFFCTPFLVYARLRGYSHQETIAGNRHGYWHFERSWLMRYIFPWALLLDTFLLALARLYLPLIKGETVICDRFVVDILADLMTGVKDSGLDRRLPGALFLRLLPRGTRVVVLDLDTGLRMQRSAELRGDRSQEMRRAVYLNMARRRGWPIVSAEPARETVTANLIAAITGAEQKGAVDGSEAESLRQTEQSDATTTAGQPGGRARSTLAVPGPPSDGHDRTGFQTGA